MKCLILGGGGHARVVIECLRLSGAAEPVAILDSDERRWGSMLDDVLIRGGDDGLMQLRSEGIDHFTVGLGHGPRARLFELGRESGLLPVTVIHPRAVISPRANIGAGGQIFATAVISPGAQLGENIIVNTGAIVEHDCVLGAHVHVAIGARLAGAVIVEDGVFIGAGSTILPGLRIGAGATVGAGAVVTKDVRAGHTVVGMPAREHS
jgi:UDP-perosamine 4-acetyltransferase